jgi:ferritin-like metal-binding protein YciE
MPSQLVKEKLVQYFNEALAMENAAADRIQSRIGETPVEQAKQQLQYHLEQTIQQQDRLKDIITNLGGSPTGAKASLPKLAPMTMDTISNTVKEAAKSITSEEDRKVMDPEKELIRTKEDAIIENAEIVSTRCL